MIANLDKIPTEMRPRVEAGLNSALTRKRLGNIQIDFIQIENSLSGGKTNAAVFVAKYGLSNTESDQASKPGSTYIRVLKIAPQKTCEAENEGYTKTRETLLDIFSQVEYHTEDEFGFEDSRYGILLYQDVGTVAASDLKGIARYLTKRILTLPGDSEEVESISRELSLLLQKEVFLSLKKGLFGNVKRIDAAFIQYYGDKLTSERTRKEFLELKRIDNTLPDMDWILEHYSTVSTYHQVNYIHGDLNPENVLVWENERGFLGCKLIDFGEVIPKKKENFTPLFWDFSRLLGEMILNFMEECIPINDESEVNDSSKQKMESFLEEFWDLVHAHFSDSKTQLANQASHLNFIVKIYISTLFDFINEAKSGLKDLRRAEVLYDYFYCQISFFIFYSKFSRENPLKRIFGIKFALKLLEYTKQELWADVLIHSLEKYYFTFSGAFKKNKIPKIGPAANAKSPFMGLAAFGEENKDFFYGREFFSNELFNAIEEKPIVVLAGASGSGKSSVVNAGLIPKLRKQNYLIYKFRPGKNPSNALIRSFDLGKGRAKYNIELKQILMNLLEQNPGKKIFLFGDQFEELFTLCKDQRDREELGFSILECAKELKTRFRFFINIRSDFWTKLLETPGFSAIVSDSGSHKDLSTRLFLGPMNTEELRSVIEKPLQVSGLKIQEGLTDLILTSISKEPGSLPLLEFCLEELWKNQIDYTLTYDSYKQIGEVKGALAAYADQIFHGLDESEKSFLKRVMVQLVQPGQGTEDTRRVALLDDLFSLENSSEEEEYSSAKLQKFIYNISSKRLITTGVNEDGKQTLEVVHEALIREWGLLKNWVNSDREFRVWQEKIRYLIKEWEIADKEEIYLLKGSGLVHAEEWLTTRRNDLGMREIDFIEKSIHHREKDLSLENERLARTKKIKNTLYVIGVAIVTFCIELTTFSYNQMRESAENEEKASIYAADMDYDTKENYLNNYYKLLKTGIIHLDKFKYRIKENINDNRIKQNLFKALAKYTYDLSTIHLIMKEKSPFFLREKYSLVPGSVQFSEDGSHIVTKEDSGGYVIRETDSGKFLQQIDVKSKYDSIAFFAKETKDLVTISRNRKNSEDCFLKVWDVNSGKEKPIKHDTIKLPSPFAFNVQKNLLISQAENKEIIVLFLFSDRKPIHFSGPNAKIESFTISGDGRILAAYFENKTIKVWDIFSYKEIKTINESSATTKVIKLSNNGKVLATALRDNSIKLWNLNSPESNNSTVSTKEEPKSFFERLFSKEEKIQVNAPVDRVFRGHYDFINSIDFSQDSRYLLSGSDDNRVILWDFYSGKELRTFVKSENVLEVSLAPSKKLAILATDTVSTSGYITFEENDANVNEIIKAIQSKKIAQDDFVKIIFDLFFDSRSFTYLDKPYRPDISVDDENLSKLLSKACLYLEPQFDHWNNHPNPPFRKKEILDTKIRCQEITKDALQEKE